VEDGVVTRVVDVDAGEPANKALLRALDVEPTDEPAVLLVRSPGELVARFKANTDPTVIAAAVLLGWRRGGCCGGT
jgi:hypothetical protein